jgi:hypothetical protein
MRSSGRSRSAQGHMAAAPKRSIAQSWRRRSHVLGGAPSLRFWRQCPTSASTRISSGSTGPNSRRMYLIDTNVNSEARKRPNANRGVIAFFETVTASSEPVFLSAISVGELRRGVDSSVTAATQTRRAASRLGWRASSNHLVSAFLPSTRTPRRSGAICASQTQPTRSTSKSPPSRSSTT